MYLGTLGTTSSTVYFLFITLFVQRHKEILQYSGYSLLYLYTHNNIYNRNGPGPPKNHHIYLKIASAGVNVLKTHISNFPLPTFCCIFVLREVLCFVLHIHYWSQLQVSFGFLSFIPAFFSNHLYIPPEDSIPSSSFHVLLSAV